MNIPAVTPVKAGTHKLRRWKLWVPAFVGMTLALLWVATIPPMLPSHAKIVAAWQPSEAWLYDRNGVLLDSQRVNFRARRLAWVPLKNVAPVLVETVIASEDKRFRDHDGVDWLAIGSAAKARLSGERSRGASTISMQVAAFLAPDLAASLRGGRCC